MCDYMHEQEVDTVWGNGSMQTRANQLPEPVMQNKALSYSCYKEMILLSNL